MRSFEGAPMLVPVTWPTPHGGGTSPPDLASEFVCFKLGKGGSELVGFKIILFIYTHM